MIYEEETKTEIRDPQPSNIVDGSGTESPNSHLVAEWSDVPRVGRYAFAFLCI
jgi:hypothetical protein